MPKLLFTGAGSDPNAIKYAGAWATGTSYNKNAQVGNDGDLFICLEAHTSAAGSEPGTGASWQTYWARSVDMLTADQMAAAAGTGTPGGSNKYVTADTLTTHGNLTGANAHGLGTISTQASSSVSITGGSILVPITVVDGSATVGLTAANCAQTLVSNYGQAAGAVTLTLPAAAAGLSFLAIVGTAPGANAWIFDPNASEVIYLEGTALTGGFRVQIATPLVGNCASWFTFQTGASAWAWYCNIISGLWVNAGS